MAEVKAFDIGQLWMILNDPSSLSHDPLEGYVKPMDEFGAEFNNSPISGPEGEFGCYGFGDDYLN